MALLVLLGASAQALAQTPAQTRPQDQLPAWELKSGGRWQPATGPAAPAIADETLDRVEEMIQNRQGDAARKIVVAWLRINKQSPIRDRGVYLLGQANFIAHNRINAFYNFDELLDFYPDSKYYYPSLERQYDIADQFLKGYKRRFLGMPFFDAKIEATEMLYRIQGRSPGSPLAEKALLRVADHYYAEGEFDVAADAYAAYVKGYPRSPYLPRVRLRQAFSALAQFRGIKFEATPIIDARQQLLDLSAMYPKIAEEENVAAIIARIDVALARKLLETANFYERTHKPNAAIYHYKYLLKLHPTLPEADRARAKLAKWPAATVDAVELPRREGETRPATSSRPATTGSTTAPANGGGNRGNR